MVCDAARTVAPTWKATHLHALFTSWMQVRVSWGATNLGQSCFFLLGPVLLTQVLVIQAKATIIIIIIHFKIINTINNCNYNGASHDSREPKRSHFSTNTNKIQRKDLQEKKERTKIVTGEQKKREIWALHPSGPHPFGTTLRGPTLPGPTLRGPTLPGTHIF